MRILQASILAAVLTGGALSPAALSQEPEPSVPAADQMTQSGTVVSVNKNTLVIRNTANVHQLFVFDRDTIRPESISEGAEVVVVSLSTGEPGVRLARRVTFADKAAQPGQAGEQSAQPAAVPVLTRRVQRDIERGARNFGFGFRAGVGMDPEVLIVGAHAKMGPIFNHNITFRPSAEFGYGEVTKFVAVNLDTAYRLPLTPHWSTWAMYIAAGPSLGFSQQNFDRTNNGINWGNLEFTPSLDIVAGLEFRKGFLVEGRAAVYASPNSIFRLMFGYSF